MLDFLAAGSASAGPSTLLMLIPWVGIAAIFYFLLIRPQMTQQKQHRQKIASIKKGDQVVTGGGKVGKVTKLLDDNHVEVEIAPNVRVKVVKSTLAEVIPPTGKPAND